MVAESWTARFSERQTTALDLLETPGVEELLYGGAKGGGKSVAGCQWLYLECRKIIAKFGLVARPYPIGVGFMGRKRGVDFGNTTLETWKRFIPADGYQIKEQAREVIIGGAVKIDFGGLDDTTAVNKFNSAEYARIFLDQAEEISRDDVSLLRGALGRLKINDRPVGAKLLLTANPAPDSWLLEFVDPARRGPHQRFVKALPTDNPWLEPDYIARLRRAFKHRPELLAAYLEGRWDVFAAVAQMIRPDWIANARGLLLRPATRCKLLVCDPARFGDDETCIYGLDDTEIALQEIYGQRDTVYTANRLLVLSRQFGASLVVIDSTGVGGGVADQLAAMGVDVLELDSARSATEPTRFYNLRAEMWDRAAAMLSGGEVSLSRSTTAVEDNDSKLVTQLCAPSYTYRTGRLLIEAKEEIKKRIGESPDRADCFVMGLAGLEFLRRTRYFGTDSVRHRAAQPIAVAVNVGRIPDHWTLAGRNEISRRMEYANSADRRWDP